MMKILLDMNLSPSWCDIFEFEGWEAVHWSNVGDPAAQDRQLMQWAANNGFIVFTHDLDFGAMLAATNATSPSVIQTRSQDILPERLGTLIVKLIRQYTKELEEGALIVVSENKTRVRILPLGNAY